MSEVTILELRTPSKSDPGFLRRQKKAMELQQAFKAGDPAAIDGIVEMLLPYVTEPTDQRAAREALLDASEEQLEGAMQAVRGESDPLAASAPTSNGKSGAGSGGRVTGRRSGR